MRSESSSTIPPDPGAAIRRDITHAMIGIVRKTLRDGAEEMMTMQRAMIPRR